MICGAVFCLQKELNLWPAESLGTEENTGTSLFDAGKCLLDLKLTFNNEGYPKKTEINTNCS